MKIRFRQEEWLDDMDRCRMLRFKSGAILENVEMIPSYFFKTEVPKKVFIAKTDKGQMRFEEWEPGVFQRIFEVL